MWIIKLHRPVELSTQRTILTGRMNQDVFIIHCVRQQSWSGLQRGIWNIVFQMPESRMGGSDDWNYLRNFVQKHRIITWNGHPILPFGLIRGKQERGGRRGKLNPDWWEDKNTQYGKLKVWTLEENGTYLDGKKVNAVSVTDYCLADGPFISVRIGVKEDAKHQGGVNLFGNSFGDYPQDIVMRILYE